MVSAFTPDTFKCKLNTTVHVQWRSFKGKLIFLWQTKLFNYHYRKHPVLCFRFFRYNFLWRRNNVDCARCFFFCRDLNRMHFTNNFFCVCALNLPLMHSKRCCKWRWRHNFTKYENWPSASPATYWSHVAQPICKHYSLLHPCSLLYLHLNTANDNLKFHHERLWLLYCSCAHHKVWSGRTDSSSVPGQSISTFFKKWSLSAVLWQNSDSHFQSICPEQWVCYWKLLL